MPRHRVDGAVGLDEEIELSAATRGMANRAEHIRLAIGSHHHAASIRKETLTCQSAECGASSSGQCGRIKGARKAYREEDVSE